MSLTTTSLAPTLDALNDAFFHQQKIPAPTARQAAAFIASRFGLPSAYAGTFALLPAEITAGIRLFTGERASHASARHIAAQEACRVLHWLRPRASAARHALDAAVTNLQRRVGPPAPTNPPPDNQHVYWDWNYRGGTYCCGPCTVAFWRHLLAGGYDAPETRLSRGIACLKDHRKNDHTYRRFPFWYTLSALIEMPESRAVRSELQFAAPRCERMARHTSDEVYPSRRAEVARRVLARI